MIQGSTQLRLNGSQTVLDALDPRGMAFRYLATLGLRGRVEETSEIGPARRAGRGLPNCGHPLLDWMGRGRASQRRFFGSVPGGPAACCAFSLECAPD